MKFCGYCGCQNEDGAAVCRECRQELAPEENPEERRWLEDPELSLRVVATFRNSVDAGQFYARLEAAGIEACVPEEYTPQIFLNLIPSPLEAVTVRVAAKDYEAAKALYDQFETTLKHRSAEPEGRFDSAPVETKEVPSNSTAKKSCVACAASIPEDADVCPRCGWTQPEVKA